MIERLWSDYWPLFHQVKGPSARIFCRPALQLDIFNCRDSPWPHEIAKVAARIEDGILAPWSPSRCQGRAGCKLCSQWALDNINEFMITWDVYREWLWAPPYCASRCILNHVYCRTLTSILLRQMFGSFVKCSTVFSWIAIQCISRHNHNLQIEELVQINVVAMEALNHSLIYQYLNLKLEQGIARIVTSRLPPHSAVNRRLLLIHVVHPLNTPKSRNLVPCYLHLDPKSGGDQPQLT